MVMSWIFTAMVAVSAICAWINGTGNELSASIAAGAQAGITLALSMAGSLCLWNGIGYVLEGAGVTDGLSKLLRPFLQKVFPSSRTDQKLAGYLSGNLCANILGLGNAATPMGIRAVKAMAAHTGPGIASNEMCALIVLNTASIQLIPATVAALRAASGCTSPFDILPAVWVTSLCSAGAGLGVAKLLGSFFRHE